MRQELSETKTELIRNGNGQESMKSDTRKRKVVSEANPRFIKYTFAKNVGFVNFLICPKSESNPCSDSTNEGQL